AIDPDVGPAAVAGGHHLVDGRVDGRILTADAQPRDDPGGVQVDDPARPLRGERGEPGADQVDTQRPGEQLAAAELVGQPPEHQRPDHLTDQVDGADRGRLRGGEVQRVGLGQLAGDRAGDGHRQTVQYPGGAQPDDQAGVEGCPPQAGQPGWNRAAG